MRAREGCECTQVEETTWVSKFSIHCTHTDLVTWCPSKRAACSHNQPTRLTGRNGWIEASNRQADAHSTTPPSAHSVDQPPQQQQHIFPETNENTLKTNSIPEPHARKVVYPHSIAFAPHPIPYASQSHSSRKRNNANLLSIDTGNQSSMHAFHSCPSLSCFFFLQQQQKAIAHGYFGFVSIKKVKERTWTLQNNIT